MSQKYRHLEPYRQHDIQIMMSSLKYSHLQCIFRSNRRHDRFKDSTEYHTPSSTTQQSVNQLTSSRITGLSLVWILSAFDSVLSLRVPANGRTIYENKDSSRGPACDQAIRMGRITEDRNLHWLAEWLRHIVGDFFFCVRILLLHFVNGISERSTGFVSYTSRERKCFFK